MDDLAGRINEVVMLSDAGEEWTAESMGKLVGATAHAVKREISSGSVSLQRAPGRSGCWIARKSDVQPRTGLVPEPKPSTPRRRTKSTKAAAPASAPSPQTDQTKPERLPEDELRVLLEAHVHPRLKDIGELMLTKWLEAQAEEKMLYSALRLLLKLDPIDT
jgi:hypothetical protein